MAFTWPHRSINQIIKGSVWIFLGWKKVKMKLNYTSVPLILTKKLCVCFDSGFLDFKKRRIKKINYKHPPATVLIFFSTFFSPFLSTFFPTFFVYFFQLSSNTLPTRQRPGWSNS